ncbi:sigma 54-interacting transcriptional regulator [Edaphobacter paludis]|uniref:Sigma 54-interacting transcriptional regulator n=1 Tax=Edaphobacter paludis TaxID=3035702 RepID=A0AAU7DCC7_9BACT
MATFSHIPSSFQRLAETRSQDARLAFSDPLQSSDWKMVGESAAIKRLRLQIRRIGPHFRAVLIQGERGTGKELVARAMHQQSMGPRGSFVVAGCGSRISSLMKIGCGGTLFFNGIDEMPLETQDELLEVLRRHEWSQDGLAAPQKLSPRIIASSSQDLRGLVASGRFRQELYQRIAMVQIALTPLRERMEDVPVLASHFLDRLTKKYRKETIIGDDAMALLKSHRWPGNVRELENALNSAVLECESGVIQPWQLSISEMRFDIDETAASKELAPEATRLQHVVDRHVLRVLKDCGGNKLRAAELLGISRSTLYRMLETVLPADASPSATNAQASQ